MARTLLGGEGHAPVAQRVAKNRHGGIEIWLTLGDGRWATSFKGLAHRYELWDGSFSLSFRYKAGNLLGRRALSEVTKGGYVWMAG